MTDYLAHPLKIDEVRAKITAQLADKQAAGALASCVMEVLKGFDGRPVNKRMVTALEKVAGIRAYLEDKPKYGTTRFLYVWGGGIEYGSRFCLAMRSETFDYAAFTGAGGPGAAYLACGNRVTEMQRVLEDLEETVNAFNSAQAALKVALMAFAPCNPF